MVTIVDLKAGLGRLAMLNGRTPTTPEAAREGAFARLAPYRDGRTFAGTSAWERHPQGDGTAHIVEGAATLHLMTEDALQRGPRPGDRQPWRRANSSRLGQRVRCALKD